jgi:hypothetical protein
MIDEFFARIFARFCKFQKFSHKGRAKESAKSRDRRPANLNKSVSKMALMAFFVTSWQLAFSYSLDTGEQRLIGCHL